MDSVKKCIIIFITDIIAIFYFVIKKAFVFLYNNADKKKLRILLYHSVSDIPFYKDLKETNVKLEMFKQQMLILKKSSRKIVNLREGVDGLKKADLFYDAIAITFDEGVKNVYNKALAVLEDLNIPAAFFIVYKYIGSGKEFMDWGMVSSLYKKGFEIGSHSYSHRHLTALEDKELYEEIVDSKKKLEEEGITVKYFAYPYGTFKDFSEKTEALIRKAGYEASFTNIMGENIPKDNLFKLKRTRVSWRDNTLRFKLKLNGAYDWVDTIKYIFRVR